MNFLHQQDMIFRLVIFDFDGTIADTSEGIFDSHKYAFSYMKRIPPSDKELKTVIGGQLLDVYTNRFGLNEEYAREIVRVYRKRYSEIGIHKATVYPGIIEVLKRLKSAKIKTGVATLKSEKFANIMLRELGICDYFDYVCGMDEKDSFTKKDLIERVVFQSGERFEDSVLIGDSNSDYVGAEQANIAFIGATYGFGFDSNTSYSFPVVNKANELIDKLRV